MPKRLLGSLVLASVFVAGAASADEPRPTEPASAVAIATMPPPPPGGPAVKGMIDRLAEDERRSRHVYGATSMAVGAAGLTAWGFLLAEDEDHITTRLAGGAGFILVANGLSALLTRGPYERLSRLGPLISEDQWASAADHERKWRKVSAIVSLVLSGALIGLGTYVVARDLDIRESRRYETATIGFGLGAAGIISGVYRLLTPGPLESGLRAYEGATGRTVAPDVGLAPMPGGAMSSLSFRF